MAKHAQEINGVPVGGGGGGLTQSSQAQVEAAFDNTDQATPVVLEQTSALTPFNAWWLGRKIKTQLDFKEDLSISRTFGATLTFDNPFKELYSQTANLVFGMSPTGNIDDTFGYVEIVGDSTHSATFPTNWINGNGGTFDNTKRNHVYLHYINNNVLYNIIKSSLTDTTAPTISSATVENSDTNKIILNYNESLLTSPLPASSDFTPSGGRTVTSVNISGVSVILTVNTAYAYGDTITVSYTSGVNKVKDLAGNNAASLINQAVTNNIAFLDVTAPFVSSAQVANATPTQIQITFNETLNNTSIPSTSDFAVSGGKTITGVGISGNLVVVTVNTAYTFGDTISVSYTGGTNKIKDLAGNDAANFSNQAVTNNVAVVDVTPPTLVSAIVNDSTPTQIELTYNEALLGSSVPSTGDFAVSGGKTVSTVGIAGTKVTVTVNIAYAFGDTITVSYTAGSNPIKDSAGNNAANLVAQSVTNSISAGDVTSPVIVSATITSGNPNKIALLYGETLLTTPLPSTSDFVVTGKTVSSIAMSGSTVTLTMSANIIQNDIVTVSYTAGTNPIKDVAGNNAANLSNYSVTNNSTTFGNLKAIDFGAAASKVLKTSANPFNLTISGAWTYTFKVKWVNNATTQILLSVGDSTTSYFQIFLNTSGQLRFTFYTDNSNSITYTSSTVLSTTSWSTIVLTGTGGGAVDLWINNVGVTGGLTFAISGTYTTQRAFTSTMKLTIGDREFVSSFPSASLLDELAFFNYRVNGSIAAEIYNSNVVRELNTGTGSGSYLQTFPPQTTNFCQGFWRFENNFNDSSPNLYHLTNNGTDPSFSTDKPA